MEYRESTKFWKSAHIKYLKKQGKDKYYKAGAFWPIILTIVLGKCMERICRTSWNFRQRARWVA